MLSIERLEVLLIVAALVAIAARRVRLPYTVGLVIAGVALSAVGVLSGFTITKDLIFRALLPPLIFEAALFIRWRDLKANLAPVLLFAAIGSVFSALVVGGTMRHFAGWTWPIALAFGALISATDPVSVIALFKEMKIGGRLRLLVESESLLNDGTAAVLFSVALIGVSGSTVNANIAAMSLVREVGGGLLSGAIVAAIVLFLAGRTTDHLVELAFTTIAAYGAFLLAEHFHCSGVLSVLVSGLMIGNLSHRGAITEHGQEAVEAFWEFAAFVSNSIIFLLIGIGEGAFGTLLLEELPVIGIAILASLVARLISIYGLSFLLRRSRHQVEKAHQHVLFWGGLKGALALALAIGLPQDMPFRQQVIAASFGVVAFSVLVQGLTMPVLLRRLGVIPDGEPAPYQD